MGGGGKVEELGRCRRWGGEDWRLAVLPYIVGCRIRNFSLKDGKDLAGSV